MRRVRAGRRRTRRRLAHQPGICPLATFSALPKMRLAKTRCCWLCCGPCWSCALAARENTLEAIADAARRGGRISEGGVSAGGGDEHEQHPQQHRPHRRALWPEAIPLIAPGGRAPAPNWRALRPAAPDRDRASPGHALSRPVRRRLHRVAGRRNGSRRPCGPSSGSGRAGLGLPSRLQLAAARLCAPLPSAQLAPGARKTSFRHYCPLSRACGVI